MTDLRVFPNGYILSLLNQLVWEFENKCNYYDNRDSCFIYLPRILNIVLSEDIRQQMGYTGINGDVDKFRGYKIFPGYEYGKIIIAHERYPDSNDERMYHSIDIVEKVDIKDKPKQ